VDLPLAESGGAALSAVVALKLALYRLLLARGTRIPVNGVIGTVYANQSMSTKSGISTMLELNETTIEKPHVLTLIHPRPKSGSKNSAVGSAKQVQATSQLKITPRQWHVGLR